MREVVLYIAMSLDGYIADRNGKVDWLEGQEEGREAADSYGEFVKTVDTVIMGWNTYDQVVTELSPDQWVYENLHTFVMTHRTEPDCVPAGARISFYQGNPCGLVKRLKGQEGKNLWISGGADLIGQLMAEDLIDLYRISVIPTILGGGIRLFGTLTPGTSKPGLRKQDSETPQPGPQNLERKLRLLDIRTDNGITELIYRKRE